ncbi:MAG: tRNA (guanosine(46)-N7)-methyltransferase TrmB, partial [Deltaproteobacteria bacterium]
MKPTEPRRHRRHANPFTLRGPIEAPDWAAKFSRRAPLALDIGCGSGLFVQALAQARPQWDVVGLEIRPHLVQQTNERMAACNLGNALCILANANAHLGELFAANSVAFVSLNFPDPWYKKRHHKRRVMQPQFLQALQPLLCDGAQIHAMTDYQ